MKILMINSVCGIRSTGRICTDLAVELEKQGHEVKIAYGREIVPAEFERFAVKIGSDLDVKIHGIKARAFDAMGFGSAKATKDFIKWVKEYDPDVIHLHNIHGYYLNIEILFDYLKSCGRKIIWTLHDCWAFTGHSAYCDAIDCTRWKTGCHNCPQKDAYPKSFIDNSKRNWLKKKEIFTGVPDLSIVTPSYWLKSLVKKSFLKEYSVKVIHNGIDTSVFQPTESEFKVKYGLEDKKVILGVAAVWEKRKGLNDFIKLSQLLNDNYSIVLVGLSKAQQKELPSAIIPIDVENDVSRLVKIYSAADVFVNPTYEDNYPTVNIEAIACGTPVITYNTGGSPEAIGNNGVVIEKGNIPELIKAIQQICVKARRLNNKCVYDKETAILEEISAYIRSLDERRTIMKLLFMTNVPSPYRVDFFNELGKLCDLTVYFEKDTSDERNDTWKNYSFVHFNGVFLKGKSTGVDNAFCPEVTKRLKAEKYDNIICGDFSTPTGMLAIRYMRKHKIPYFLEADGGTAKSGRGLRERIKKYFIKGAAGYFSTSASCDNYFITYGADKDKIYRYPFTSLHESDILKKPPTKAEKKTLREQLKLEEDKILISVGRFSYLNGYGKGYDTLLKICEHLPENIGVYIIGDEPTEEFVRWKNDKHLDRLHYLPFKRKEELFKYYQAADLSVFLSRGEAWGLVVNESMANGLPVITTDACVAGLELVENGKNGYIVPVDSVNETRSVILDLLSNDHKIRSFSTESINAINNYSIENMSKIHTTLLRR